MMHKEYKEEWIAALRSGNYEQTTGELRNQYGHCCLGVLCDIYDNSKWNNNYLYCEEECVLPEWLRQEMDLDVSVEQTLIALNDRGKSFQEIATYIEENL